MINTLVVVIPEAEKKIVLKEFKDLMKKHQGELDKEKKQSFPSNTIIPKISKDPITVYFSVEDKTGGVVILTTGFKLDGEFISYANAKPQFNGARNFIRDFAVKSAKAAKSKKLEAALKVNSKLVKEHEKLKKEKEKLDKSIVANKKKL